MCARRVIDFQGLSVQLIVSYIFLALCTSVLIGLPAFLLINDRMETYGWAQVEHGLRSSQTLYNARQGDMIDLTRIIAQRPTLREALTNEAFQSILPYLEVLGSSAGVDGILLCEHTGSAQ